MGRINTQSIVVASVAALGVFLGMAPTAIAHPLRLLPSSMSQMQSNVVTHAECVPSRPHLLPKLCRASRQLKDLLVNMQVIPAQEKDQRPLHWQERFLAPWFEVMPSVAILRGPRIELAPSGTRPIREPFDGVPSTAQDDETYAWVRPRSELEPRLKPTTSDADSKHNDQRSESEGETGEAT